MALFLSSISLTLTAQEVTIIIHQLNRFHLLNVEAVDYQDNVTAILLSLNQILNRWRFEAVTTHNHTIIMVSMGL